MRFVFRRRIHNLRHGGVVRFLRATAFALIVVKHFTLPLMLSSSNQ